MLYGNAFDGAACVARQALAALSSCLRPFVVRLHAAHYGGVWRECPSAGFGSEHTLTTTPTGGYA
jgi:hypothetical protein